MPNPFRRIRTGNLKLRNEKTAAKIHPETIAGSSNRRERVPRRIRKMLAPAAQGRKNRRLIPRTDSGLSPRTSVSQRIRRLPPPTPIPDKKPRIVPMIKENGSVFNTGSGFLPIKSKLRVPDEANVRESVHRTFLPTGRQPGCRGGREGHLQEKRFP